MKQLQRALVTLSTDDEMEVAAVVACLSKDGADVQGDAEFGVLCVTASEETLHEVRQMSGVAAVELDRQTRTAG